MNFSAALTAINNGNKIRRSAWKPNLFIALNNANQITPYHRLSRTDYLISFEEMKADNWFALDDEERNLVTFDDALEFAQNGSKISRDSWPEETYLRLNEQKEFVHVSTINYPHLAIQTSSYLLEDWEIYEPENFVWSEAA